MNGLSSKICRRLYLPVLDWYKASPYEEVAREAHANQYRPVAELQALQAEKLRRLLAHAEQNSPFYRQRFRQAALTPSTIRSTEDLSALPLLDKESLFEHSESIKAKVESDRVFASSTSGSTGVAMRFLYNSRQWAWAEACQWRGRGWWGVRRGDRCLALWARPVGGASVRATRALKHGLRNTLQFDTFEDFNSDKLDEIVQALRWFRPAFLYGYGSSIGRLAVHMEEKGVRLRGSARPRMVEYTADHMHANEVQVAARVFGAPILSAYGASEAPGIAQQCWAGNAHVSIDQVVVEFLREDGTRAEPDEDAEIVVTPLHNLAMPMIRYRVGDRGSYSAGACPCGVTLPRMNLTVGKAVDLVTTSTHEKVSAHLFDYINIHLMQQGIRGIRQFFIEQTARDRFELRVVREEPFDPRCVQVFAVKMKERLGAQIVVDTIFVDSVPISASGKRRYFSCSC